MEIVSQFDHPDTQKGLEEVLRCFIEEDQPDMNRQIQFIIKQMNSKDQTTTDDPHSDTDDDDDEDEEGDAVDAEVDQEEPISAKPGELAGEQLLSTHYLGILSKVSSSLDVKNKKKLNGQDGPLTRPITPRGHQQQQKLHAIPETSSREQSNISARPKTQDRPTTQERPRTQSSKATSRKPSGSSRPATQETDPRDVDPSLARTPSKVTPRPSSKALEKAGSGRARTEDYTRAFSSKPKIPRTPSPTREQQPPFSGPRPGSANPPKPTQSVSPPLPRASSSRSQGSSSVRDSPVQSRGKSRK